MNIQEWNKSDVKLYFVNFKIMIYQIKEEEIEVQQITREMQNYYNKIINKKRLKYVHIEI